MSIKFARKKKIQEVMVFTVCWNIMEWPFSKLADYMISAKIGAHLSNCH